MSTVIKRLIMSKVTILKELPKSSKPSNHKPKTKLISNPSPNDSFSNSYLDFYDDIKIPGKRYDW